MTLRQRRHKISLVRRALSTRVNAIEGRFERDEVACIERQKLLALAWQLFPNPMVQVTASGAVYGAPLKRKRNLSVELGAL